MSPINLPSTIEALSGASGMSLELLLAELCRAGAPRISMHGSGWYCAVDMHVSAAGTQFKVASDFHKPTPRDAAVECAQRVVATLKQYAPT
jgi:hypothetical protein